MFLHKHENLMALIMLGVRLGGSPTLANLGNGHEFISKEYISIGMSYFGEAQSKAMRVYA